jgi:hypothetical protein
MCRETVSLVECNMNHLMGHLSYFKNCAFSEFGHFSGKVGKFGQLDINFFSLRKIFYLHRKSNRLRSSLFSNFNLINKKLRNTLWNLKVFLN